MSYGNASAITNYVSKMAHPLASGALFSAGHSVALTGTIEFNGDALMDFAVQSLASYGGELVVAPTIKKILPTLPQSVTQSISTAGLNVLLGMLSDKFLEIEGEDTGKEILYRFIISLGAEAVTGALLDGSLSFVGAQLTPPSTTVGGSPSSAFRGVGSLH